MDTPRQSFTLLLSTVQVNLCLAVPDPDLILNTVLNWGRQRQTGKLCLKPLKLETSKALFKSCFTDDRTKFLLVDVVKTFIDYGADINAHDNMGYTPLFYAVIADNVDTTMALIAAGANTHHK